MTQRLDTFHHPDKEFTDKEQDLVRSFRTLCKIDHLATFSSDTFRMYGLDRFITDKQHGIGGFFAKLSANKLVEKVGWMRSTLPTNHGRPIQTYRWRT
jgi:hypothetical protein